MPTPSIVSANLGSLNAVSSPFMTKCARFTLGLAGTWVGTVTLQRSFNYKDTQNASTATWRSVTAYSANAEEDATNSGGDGVAWRFQFTAYTSGTCEVKLQSAD